MVPKIAEFSAPLGVVLTVVATMVMMRVIPAPGVQILPLVVMTGNVVVVYSEQIQPVSGYPWSGHSSLSGIINKVIE